MWRTLSAHIQWEHICSPSYEKRSFVVHVVEPPTSSNPTLNTVDKTPSATEPEAAPREQWVSFPTYPKLLPSPSTDNSFQSACYDKESK